MKTQNINTIPGKQRNEYTEENRGEHFMDTSGYFLNRSSVRGMIMVLTFLRDVYKRNYRRLQFHLVILNLLKIINSTSYVVWGNFGSN